MVPMLDIPSLLVGPIGYCNMAITLYSKHALQLKILQCIPLTSFEEYNKVVISDTMEDDTIIVSIIDYYFVKLS